MAAEFKIGRLRYTWNGPWTTGTSYIKDAVVSYDGKTYVALLANTASPNFYTDLNSTPYATWQLVLDGKTFVGAWTSARPLYNLGNIAIFGGKLYYCNTQHVPTAFASQAAYWTEYSEFFNWNSAGWVAGNAYGANDVVKWGGVVYKCVTNHTSATYVAPTYLGLENDQANWTVINSGVEYKGSWDTLGVGYRYKLNDLVRKGPDLWISNSGHISTTTFDQTKWAQWMPGYEYAGTWSNSVTYQSGDTVTYGGYTYECITPNTKYDPTANGNTGNPPSVDSTDWTVWIQGYELKQDWSAATKYLVGDIVRRDGMLFVASVDNTSRDPSGFTTSATPTSIASTTWTSGGAAAATTVTLTSGTGFASGQFFSGNGVAPNTYITNVSGAVITISNPFVSQASGTYKSFSGTTTFPISSTTGIVAGMYVVGTGFSGGQVVSAVVDGFTLLLNRPADSTPTDTTTLSFSGVNATYWKVVVPGTQWTKTWMMNSNYVVGDIAVWQNGTYLCISNHTASYNSSIDPVTKVVSVTGNRPDIDPTNMYWVFYIPHARKNALNTLGDIETYKSGKYQAVPIGTSQYVLRNISGIPTWTKIMVVPAVYYVATTGIDRSDYGTNWDQPFKSINYAAKFITNSVNYPNTVALIIANKSWLITEMYQWMMYQMANNIGPFTTNSVFDATKTQRDAGLIIDSIVYDLSRGGNSQTVAAALSYFAYGSTGTFFSSTILAEINFFTAALVKLSSLISTNVIPQQTPAQNYQSLTAYTPLVYQTTGLTAAETANIVTGAVSGAQAATTLMSIITTALSTQSTSAIPPMNRGITATIFVKTGTYLETLPISVPENTAVVGDELRSVVVQPAISLKLTAIRADNTLNLFTVNTTTGLVDSMPVQFADPDITTTYAYTPWGGITTGKTYYIYGPSITATGFSVMYSPTTVFTGTVTSGSTTISNVQSVTNIIAGAKITGPGIPSSTTVVSVSTTSFVISQPAVSSTISATITSTGAIVPLQYYGGGLTMTVLAGDCIQDMFRLRNGTGLRNMTFFGLKGTLGAPDSFGIQRPSGGSYACLDPGLGPNDTTAWIFRRSPYVQNVTAFGDGCGALKIDGALHNGGNKSIVANDFTHIVNDGIGVWCTGPSALTEVVSVFSYYGYSGYMADAGGRIRATNGNTSYGSYGVIATGYDSTETPGTGIIYNQSSQVQAVVQQAYGSSSQLLRLDYTNAGSAYYTTTTNLLNYSNSFNSVSAWNTDGNVGFSKVTLAPSGNYEAWNLTGLTGGPGGAYIDQVISIPKSGGVFTGQSTVNQNSSGVGAVFTVTVTSTAYTVVITNPGSNYAVLDIVFVPGANLGGVTGVNNCYIQVTALSGNGIQSAIVLGTSVVPSGSAFNYTASVYVKQGTAASIDLYAIYSGSSTVTSSINYNFNTQAITGSNANGGFLPVAYGAINQQTSATANNAGWYRLWFAFNDTTGLNTQLRFRISPRGNSGTINQYTYFYGAQVEISPTALTPSFYLEVNTVSKYTAYANYNVTGAGTGVVTVGDEVRSQSVFQSRVLTDSNGVTGGANWLTASNNAQSGSTQYIQLAGSDTKTNGNYSGMRIFINSGTGAGQYGYISYYNTSNKFAWVLRESFTPLQVTSSSGNTFTVSGSTNTFYQNMPVQFIPTYFTSAISATSLSQTLVTSSIGGTTNTFTVNSTDGMFVGMPVSFTAAGAQAIFSTVTTGYLYYVFSINPTINGNPTTNTIQISANPLTQSPQVSDIWSLSTVASGNMTLNFSSNTSYLQGSTTNMVVNYPIQFTGTALGGISVGTIYYIQDVVSATLFTISGTLVNVTVTSTSNNGNTLQVVSTAQLVPLTPIVFTNSVFDAIVDSQKYYISTIPNTTTFTVSASLITATATLTETISNLITLSSTAGMVQYQPIVFVGSSFGGIQAEVIYYISTIANNKITIAPNSSIGTGAVQMTGGVGNMTAKTCPASVTLTGASGSMVGTSTAAKTSLSQGSGTMNATFSTSLFGGISIGTTYYINSFAGSGFTVSLASGSGLPLNLGTVVSGSMQVAASGWDHINAGTPLVSNFDSSTVYYIEPRTIFSSPGFSQANATTTVTLSAGTSWIAMAYGNGLWIALPSGNSVGAYSVDGKIWSSLALPSSTSWSSVAYGNSYWVIIANGANTAAVSNANGQGWTTTTLPSSSSWSQLTYGNGVFVAVSIGTNKAAYSTDYGQTWSAATLPSVSNWSGVTYGKGIFVAVSTGSTAAAYSVNNGQTWIAGTLPAIAPWSSVAFGSNVFVTVSNVSSTSAYSSDGINWLSSNLSIAADVVAYGQGVFVGVSYGNTLAWTSEDGISWNPVTVSSDSYGCMAFGFAPSTRIGVFATLSGTAKGSAISAGCTLKGRALITSGTITGINIWEPGSNYTSAPSVIITDPNVTTLAILQQRTSNGVLSSPNFVNRGAGYSTATTSVIITGNGYADQYQTGLTIIMNNLSRLPVAGDNITIAGVSQNYKVTSSYVVYNTVAPNIQANISISPAMVTANATANGTTVSIRSKYSQARLTNHDFLNVGYGDFLTSNYPGSPAAGYSAIANNQTIEANFGRVFYTSTDQDGNFKVGNLFGVQQATGIVTLSASQFGLSGLSSLSLGGIAVGGSSVQITQFSTDGTFTANSDSILPTQRAIKTYLSARLSTGGADTFTGQLTAGTVIVGGATFIRSTVANGQVGSRINVTSKVNVAGSIAGIDGNMAAMDFWFRHSMHKSYNQG